MINPREMTREMLINEIYGLRDERDAYRSYYLMTEESFRLANTVGVNADTWRSHRMREQFTAETCSAIERERECRKKKSSSK